MKMPRIAAFYAILWIIGLGLAACFSSGAGEDETERIATRVAEEQAVAATLTAAGQAQRAELPAQSGPTPTLVTIALLPVDGEDGNLALRGTEEGEGRNVLLPGFAASEVRERMVFGDRLVFQVEVFDPAVGSDDGDGIAQAAFNLFDANNYRVFAYVDATPPYCVFGGEPACDVLVFAQSGNRWPNGRSITNGPYLAEIVITPEAGEAAIWRWRFWIER
jgi:hypothetical protein